MQSPIRIVVIGSSTAAGHGAVPPDLSWVNRYKAYLQRLHPDNDIVNLGLGGLQTFQLLPTGHQPPPARPLPDPERNISKALSLHPDAVIVNAPSNDAAAFYGPEEQLLNFDIIIQTARAAGVPVWICTTQPRIFSAEQIDIQIRLKDAILKRYGQHAINVWDCLSAPDHLPLPHLDLGDGTHLNNDGHEQVFKQVKAKGLPELVSEWHLQYEKEQKLNAGPQLQIPELTSGEVQLEVYDAQAQLRYQASTTLPCTIQDPIGPPGQYWVKVAGTSYHKTISWVKTN